MRSFVLLVAGLIAAAPHGRAQTFGILQGTVTLQSSGEPLHNASVLIAQLGRTVHTDEKGNYEFRQVPPGVYKVVAHLGNALSDNARSVTVAAGQATRADFALQLATLRQEITVTASGREETVFDSFQSVHSLDSIELSLRTAPAIGEVLEKEPGVAKRSFGPGSSRPVVRGFDGDRVLIMQDGIGTGTLSSQSGDHGEIVNPSTLERLEVVRGPATLLYGSNAIGGVVNAVTREHDIHEHPHPGVTGHLSATGGTANAYGGGSGSLQFGYKNWLLWTSGGGQRTGDYHTPIGRILNSDTQMRHAAGGAAWYGDRAFVTTGYNYGDNRYGIPFDASSPDAERVALDLHRHNLRLTAGARQLGSFVESLRITLNYSDYRHKELELEELSETVGTRFKNKQFVYRGVFEQRKRGVHTGSFGFSGLQRDYVSSGLEALSPPVNQSGFAAFTLQTLDYDRVRFQFGGRYDHTSYDPRAMRAREFDGFSGSAGIQFRLWPGGVFVTNYTHSYRAPALEELYNRGPHPGNVTFEIGNDSLTREAGDGVDLALRHQGDRVRTGINLYYYRLHDFVFLAPTGETEDGLPVAEYAQAGTRYLGAEATLDLGLHRNLWLNLSTDVVDAQLRDVNTPLPRIPPVRGVIGVEARYKTLSVAPELTLVNRAHQVFPLETPTAGYATFSIRASFTVTQQHLSHSFALNAFNLNDRLYRNHLSFIKELAPEIGRGVRFTYMVRFF